MKAGRGHALLVAALLVAHGAPSGLPRAIVGGGRSVGISRVPCLPRLHARASSATERVPPRAGGGDVSSPEWARPAALPPLKAMLFIDGTWLYYSLFERGERCAIRELYGENWRATHCVDVSQLPPIIAEDISVQLSEQLQTPRVVEVVRTLVFTSYRQDVMSEQRVALFEQMQALNYEVHLGSFQGVQEKCVDIALAVELLHYATVPDAYDIGVLVSGDRDFIPALVRARQRGRRIAIASMRNSCNREFSDPSIHVKDFETTWLDDQLARLIVPRADLLEPVLPPRAAAPPPADGAPTPAGDGPSAAGAAEAVSRPRTSGGRVRIAQQASLSLDSWLVSLVIRCVSLSSTGLVSSRTIGRFLSRQIHGRVSALEHLKARHGRLSSFLQAYTHIFAVEHNSPTATTKTEFHVRLGARGEELSQAVLESAGFDDGGAQLRVGMLGADASGSGADGGLDDRLGEPLELLDEAEAEEEEAEELSYGEVFEGRGADEGGRIREMLQRGHMVELDPEEAGVLRAGRRGFDAARQAKRARRQMEREEAEQDELYDAPHGDMADSAYEADERRAAGAAAQEEEEEEDDYDEDDLFFPADAREIAGDDDGDAFTYAFGASPADSESEAQAAPAAAAPPMNAEHLERIGDEYDEADDIVAMTREELREELRLHGLPISGTKEELRSRLMLYIADGLADDDVDDEDVLMYGEDDGEGEATLGSDSFGAPTGSASASSRTGGNSATRRALTGMDELGAAGVGDAETGGTPTSRPASSTSSSTAPS